MRRTERGGPIDAVSVIGVSGYAGGHVVHELIDRGHYVRAVARDVGAIGPDERLLARAGSLIEPTLLDDLFADSNVLVLATSALDGGISVADALPLLLAATGRAFGWGHFTAAALACLSRDNFDTSRKDTQS